MKKDFVDFNFSGVNNVTMKGGIFSKNDCCSTIDFEKLWA